jgi:hypothetical protein
VQENAGFYATVYDMVRERIWTANVISYRGTDISWTRGGTIFQGYPGGLVRGGLQSRGKTCIRRAGFVLTGHS